jgi:exopolysaccharide production protein ExoY
VAAPSTDGCIDLIWKPRATTLGGASRIMTALQPETVRDDLGERGQIALRRVEAGLESGPRQHGWRRHAKRTMDIALGSALLIVLLPLMAVIAVMLKVRSRGPVLFRHERIGRNGETFQMFKFRTMYIDATDRLRVEPELFQSYVHNDFKVPLQDDPRIVPGGRFLRRWSLDELPQLFNVLAGTMSLVGPRPIVAGELECYGPYSTIYLDVKPGITGRWQIDGRNQIRYPQRARLDADYVTNWSLGQDVAILLKTVPAVLRRRGAH